MKYFSLINTVTVILLGASVAGNAFADSIELMSASIKNQGISETMASESQSDEEYSAVAWNPVTVSDALYEAGSLFLDVSYSGGCRDHKFKLVVEDCGLVNQASPQLIECAAEVVRIEGQDDLCERWIQDTLEFAFEPATDSLILDIQSSSPSTIAAGRHL